MKLQERLSKRFGPLTLLKVGRNGKDLYFVFKPKAKRPFLVCHTYRNELDLVKRQAFVRQEIYSALPPLLRESIPHCMTEDFSDSIAIIEPFTEGVGTQPTRRTMAAFGQSALAWLSSFQQATSRDSSRLLSEEAKDILAWGGEKLAMEGWLKKLHPKLRLLDSFVPCAVHGDFWYGNLMLDKGELRIVDWGDVEIEGNPLFDPMLYLLTLSNRFMERGEHFFQEAGRLLSPFLGDKPREAAALTTVLVLIKLISREADPFDNTHYPVLERISREGDPLGRITRALWPNQAI